MLHVFAEHHPWQVHISYLLPTPPLLLAATLNHDQRTEEAVKSAKAPETETCAKP